MIYLKENRINKFGSNKIYLKDKLIYQALKGEEPIVEGNIVLGFRGVDTDIENKSINDFISNTTYSMSQNSWFTDSKTTITKDEKSLLIDIGTNNLLSNSFSDNYASSKNIKQFGAKCWVFKCNWYKQDNISTFYYNKYDTYYINFMSNFLTLKFMDSSHSADFTTPINDLLNRELIVVVDWSTTDTLKALFIDGSNYSLIEKVEVTYEGATEIINNTTDKINNYIDFRPKSINKWYYTVYTDYGVDETNIKQLEDKIYNN